METTTRARLRAPQRRAVIEAAAARLFAEHGYAATRLDDIAAAAQVTKPILYRHFASKKALYLALLVRHREQQLSLAPPAGPPLVGEPTLPMLLERWFDQVHEHAQTWRMIFRDSTGDADIQAARTAARENARGLIAAYLVGAGHIPSADEIEPAAELVRSAMAGLALWSLDHPEVPHAFLASLINQIVLALQPGEGPYPR